MLIDTSVLVRWANPLDPQQKATITALDLISDKAEPLLIAPQCLYEFWVVATRPSAQNGLGWDTIMAASVSDDIADLFTTVAETPAVLAHWQRLVRSHAVAGRQAHDARLVALMQTVGETDILTFNGDDFKRYPGVTPRHPKDV